MITFILYTFAFLVWGGLLTLAIYLLTESHQFVEGLAVTLIVCALTYWFFVQLSENKPPCAKYETVMQYNPVIKNVAPMRYCAIEGEWVK